MVVESFPSWDRRRKDGVRQFEKTYESPVLPFAERVMWKDPTLQPANVRSSWVYGLWLERSQTSNAHLIGTRVGIVVARTIRRLPTSEREDSSLVAMRSTPVAGRPADVAAGDAPTVTRQAVERKEVIVVPAISGAPLQVGSGEGVSAPSNPVPNLPRPTVARAQPSSAAVESSQHPSWERVDSFGPGGVVPVEVAQAVEPTTKSHARVEEHDESLVPKKQMTTRYARPAKSGITRIHSWMSRLRRPQQQTLGEMSTETHRTGSLCFEVYVTFRVMSS